MAILTRRYPLTVMYLASVATVFAILWLAGLVP
jgi:hypothetical protein